MMRERAISMIRGRAEGEVCTSEHSIKGARVRLAHAEVRALTPGARILCVCERSASGTCVHRHREGGTTTHTCSRDTPSKDRCTYRHSKKG